MCPDLTISNGTVDTSPPGRVFNSRTIYTCDEGYALKGDGNRVCQIDSTWDGTDPECGMWFLCIYSTSYSYFVAMYTMH